MRAELEPRSLTDDARPRVAPAPGAAGSGPGRLGQQASERAACCALHGPGLFSFLAIRWQWAASAEEKSNARAKIHVQIS